MENKTNKSDLIKRKLPLIKVKTKKEKSKVKKRYSTYTQTHTHRHLYGYKCYHCVSIVLYVKCNTLTEVMFSKDEKI